MVLNTRCETDEQRALNVTCIDANTHLTCEVRNLWYAGPITAFNFLNADERKGTTSFQMTWARFPVIPSNLFQQFPDIYSVKIKSDVKRIDKENFIGADNLKDLYLRYNQIEKIPANVFVNAINLDRVFLAKNRISEIEAYAFNGSNKLSVINLEENRISKIDSLTFVGAVNLKELRLSSNKISNIEDGVLNFPKLEKIHLSFNQLQALSDNVFADCPELADIWLNGNNLATLGKSLDSLTKLSLLSVSTHYTELSDFDFDAIARKPHMEFYLATNIGLKLKDPESLPDEIYSVKELDISDNNLAYADILFRLKNFKNLKELNISRNNFTIIDDIDRILEILPKLRKFRFRRNPCKDDVLQKLREKFGYRSSSHDDAFFYLN